MHGHVGYIRSEPYVTFGSRHTVSFLLSLSELIRKHCEKKFSYRVTINQSQPAYGAIHTSQETYVTANFPAGLCQTFSIFHPFCSTVFDSWNCRYTKSE